MAYKNHKDLPKIKIFKNGEDLAGAKTIRLCLNAGWFFLTLLYVMDVKNKRMLFPSEVSARNRHLCRVLQHLTGSLASEIMQSSGGLSSKCIIQGQCDSTCMAKHTDQELPGAEPSEGGWGLTGEHTRGAWNDRKKRLAQG